MQINASIDVRSAPQAVFGWLESPDKARQWMTGVTATQIVHETPERVGTTFRETVSDAGGSLDIEGVITGFVPNESIAFHLRSRVHELDVEYRVGAIPMGSRVEAKADIRWKFPLNLVSLVAGGKMRRKIAAQLHDEFTGLKALCERGPAA